MNQVKTLILLAGLAGLLVVIGGVIGGRNGALIALGIAAVMNFASYWFSDKIVLRMYHAQEVTEAQAPELYRLVGQLAQQAGLPMPKVYIVPDQSPNAFATGRNPDNAVVAVTEGILRLLTWEELSGVIGHELGHVKHRDILIQSVAATIGAAITYLAQFAFFFGGASDDDEGRGGNVVTMILMMILAPLAAMIIQMAISRSREYLADQAGATFCGHPMWLANALAKLQSGAAQIPMRVGSEATAHMCIVNPFSARGVMRSLFSTHPPMEERIARLEEMAGR
jgi:heat shock protein HtpX